MSRKQLLYDALFIELKPDLLIIDNESHRHNVPEGAETHFKVIAVSSHFEHLNRIARHRLVNSLVANEFTQGLHALSLHLYTPDEWLKQNKNAPTSPACRGGKKHSE